jgi:hypothetical protein
LVIVALVLAMQNLGDSLVQLGPELTADEVPLKAEVQGSEFSMWARGEYWYAQPNGQLKITLGSRPGTGDLVRVGEEMGLRTSSVPGGEIGASLGDHRVRLSYLDLRFKGSDSDLDQTLIFHGQTYTAGEPVRSQVDLPRLSLIYDYDIWDTAWTKCRVGALLHFYWFSARLTSDTHDEKRAYTRGIPALALSVGAKVEWVRIDADGSIGYTDSSHDFFGGVRLLVGATLWGGLEAGLGYGWERLDASAETNRVTLTVHGPTAVLTLRF